MCRRRVPIGAAEAAATDHRRARLTLATNSLRCPPPAGPPTAGQPTSPSTHLLHRTARRPQARPRTRPSASTQPPCRPSAPTHPSPDALRSGPSRRLGSHTARADDVRDEVRPGPLDTRSTKSSLTGPAAPSLGREDLDGSTWTMPSAMAASRESTVTSASAWSWQTAKYSASSVVSNPCAMAIRHSGSTRHPVAQQSHLEFRHPFVTPKRLLFVEDPVAYVGEQQIERVGADQIGSDELMGRIDPDVVGHNVEQRPSIDHVSGHVGHKYKPADKPATRRRHQRRRWSPRKLSAARRPAC